LKALALLRGDGERGESVGEGDLAAVVAGLEAHDLGPDAGEEGTGGDGEMTVAVIGLPAEARVAQLGRLDGAQEDWWQPSSSSIFPRCSKLPATW